MKLHALLRSFLLWVLSAGPIPSHIAIIMDGNRRFADRLGVDRWIGHNHGYEALMRTLKDCFDLHVKTVSLYAFSIDNFRRPPDEVSALMDLMQSKLESLIEKEGIARSYGVRVRVLGDLALLPEGVRKAAEKVMDLTRHNQNAVLNLFVSYSSTHEIVRSAQRIRDDFCNSYRHGVDTDKSGEDAICIMKGNRDDFRSSFGHDVDPDDSEGKATCTQEDCLSSFGHVMDPDDSGEKLSCMQEDFKRALKQHATEKEIGRHLYTESSFGHVMVDPDDSGEKLAACLQEDFKRVLEQLVTEKEIERHLYTESCAPPELLIRTSGETRLSNFMLWQTSFSHLAFLKVLWPEFSLKDLFFVILEYQRTYPNLLQKQQSCKKVAS